MLIPKFRFMVHDRWANVLFLHWRVPSHLEETLADNTAPFVVDRYDGSMWIGLILLTEEGVGPSIGRSRWTCVTHHGINVRTYVRGVSEPIRKKEEEEETDDGSNRSQDDDPKDSSQKLHHREDIISPERGIHFSSLECDDEFTSFGANFFGMPYRVAKMVRTYDHRIGLSGGAAENDIGEKPSTQRQRDCRYTIRSERFSSGRPSIVRLLFHSLTWWRPRGLHSITNTTTSSGVESGPHQQQAPNRGNGSGAKSEQFSVDCAWTRRDDSNGNDEPTDSFHGWAAERYLVYTHRYGRNWRGRVDHEPWPVTSVTLERLEISGIEKYEPSAMRPVLRHMADHKPDRVGFSTGVGPVHFTMLQPVVCDPGDDGGSDPVYGKESKHSSHVDESLEDSTSHRKPPTADESEHGIATVA